MAGNISLTYDQISQISRSLDQGRQNIDDQLTTMKQQVDELISSGFVTDQASGAFGQSYQEFTTGSTQTIDGMQKMTSFLDNAVSSMQDLDSQLAAGIRS